MTTSLTNAQTVVLQKAADWNASQMAWFNANPQALYQLQPLSIDECVALCTAGNVIGIYNVPPNADLQRLVILNNTPITALVVRGPASEGAKAVIFPAMFFEGRYSSATEREFAMHSAWELYTHATTQGLSIQDMLTANVSAMAAQ